MIVPGKFSKRTFKGYGESGCLRKLYLNIGNDQEGWTYGDGTKVTLEEYNQAQAETVVVYGKIFEDEYLYWLKFHESHHILDCTPKYLDDEKWPDLSVRQEEEACHWKNIQQSVLENGFVFAFELMWKPEEDFIKHFVGTEAAKILLSSRGDRPDVLLFEHVNEEDRYFFLQQDGSIVEERCHHKGIAITILDIKNTEPQKCKKHFADIVYYILSLLFRIQALGYSQTMRIRLEGNGVLGRIDFHEIKSRSPTKLRDIIRNQGKTLSTEESEQRGHVCLDWELYVHLCSYFRTGLHEILPYKASFEKVAPRISSKCHYCIYAHHCLNGNMDTRNPSTEKMASILDSVAVLVKMTVQAQESLERAGVHNVADLIVKADLLKKKNWNQSVCDEYAPFLRQFHFQALAIQKNTVLDQNDPDYQKIWSPGAFTVELPTKIQDMIFIDVEIDSAQNRLCSLSFLFRKEQFVCVNPSIDDEGERFTVESFCVALKRYITTFTNKNIVFWNKKQCEQLSSILSKYPDVSETNEEFFQIFSTETHFSSPKYQAAIFDLKKAVETLFAFPIRFSYAWHEVYEHLSSESTDIHLPFWGAGKDVFDFSIWNLYVGEYKDTHSSKRFSTSAPNDVITTELSKLFQEYGVFHHPTVGWQGNPILLVLIQTEIEKKLKALVEITKICYQRSQKFISPSPLAGSNRSSFEIPTVPVVMSQISKLLWNYEMVERWSTFCSVRERTLFPHESVFKQCSAWLIPPKKRGGPYRFPKISAEVECLESEWMFVIEKDAQEFSLAGGSAKKIHKRNKEIFPSSSNYAFQEGLVTERYGDIWLESCIALQKRLLNQSALSDNMPIDANEEWGTIPFQSAPHTAELYFLNAPLLREKGRVEIEDTLLSIGDIVPSEDQKKAIFSFLRNPFSLIQGPPGTGKSTTILTMLKEWIVRRKDTQTSRILLSAANYAAMTVVADKIAEDSLLEGIPMHIMNYRSRENIEVLQKKAIFVDWHNEWSSCIWDGTEYVSVETDLFPETCIVVANEYSLARLFRHEVQIPNFDLIVIDEASQLAPDHFLSCLAFVHPLQMSARGTKIEIHTSKEQWTKVLIVGDGDQLSAVRKVEPPKQYRDMLRSTYSFYEQQFQRAKHETIQLRKNYRSVATILECINMLNIYKEDLQEFKTMNDIPSWIQEARFFSEKDFFSVGILIHQSRKDVRRSPIEIEHTVQAVLRLWSTKPTDITFEEFFSRHIGIVTPHNAQRISLGDALCTAFQAYLALDDTQKQEQETILRGSIRTVDKFQGSDRSVIIASMGVSSPVRLQEEEAFLFHLNRFNVTISRPKFRLVFICSQTFVHHIPKSKEAIMMVKGLNAIIKKVCVWEHPLSSAVLHYSKV